jgi:hypothetical protein
LPLGGGSDYVTGRVGNNNGHGSVAGKGNLINMQGHPTWRQVIAQATWHTARRSLRFVLRLQQNEREPPKALTASKFFAAETRQIPFLLSRKMLELLKC